MVERAARHSSKEMRDLFKAAEKAGWVVRGGGQSHFVLKPPAGAKAPLIVVSSSSHGGRGYANTRSQLRRHGVAV